MSNEHICLYDDQIRPLGDHLATTWRPLGGDDYDEYDDYDDYVDHEEDYDEYEDFNNSDDYEDCDDYDDYKDYEDYEDYKDYNKYDYYDYYYSRSLLLSSWLVCFKCDFMTPRKREIFG